MTVKLDKKDLDILANARSNKPSSKLRNLGLIGFLAVFSGGVVFVSGRFYGLAIASAGMILLGVSVVLTNKQVKAEKKKFLEYYETHGELPPWPEEVSK